MRFPIALTRPLAFFDLETTGLDVKKDRIVEIAIVRHDPGGALFEKAWRINPTIPISKEAAEVHGINDEDVADKPYFTHLAKEIREVLNDSDLAGFNLRKFDIPMLLEEFKRAGRPLPMDGRRVIDAQMIYHKEEPRNLANGFRFYTGHTLRDAHSALADTRATAAILAAQLLRYSRLPKDVDGLHAYCDEIEADGGWFKKHESAGPGSDWVIQRGKHKGRLVSDMKVGRDIGYLHWISRLDDLNDSDRAVLRQVLR